MDPPWLDSPSREISPVTAGRAAAPKSWQGLKSPSECRLQSQTTAVKPQPVPDAERVAHKLKTPRAWSFRVVSSVPIRKLSEILEIRPQKVMGRVVGEIDFEPETSALVSPRFANWANFRG